MVNFEKLTYPANGTRIEIVDGKPQVPDDPIIPFIRGDGIGLDITPAMQKTLDGAVEKAYGGKRKIHWFEVHAGLSALELYGDDRILPDDTIEAIRHFKIAIKGPLTTPVGGFKYVCMACAKEQDGIDGKRPEKCVACGSPYITTRFRSMNVGLRQVMDLYACVRPVRWFQGVPSPVKRPENLNIVVFRENTEDVYAGLELKEGTEKTRKFIDFCQKEFNWKIRSDSGIGIKPISQTASKRLIRAAIEYTLKHKRKSITLVHKGNIQKFTEGAFRSWGYEVAKEEYPDKIISWEECQGRAPQGKILMKDIIADIFFQQILTRPEEFDVIATTNLNGDYISDALAAQVGGVGISPGANINFTTGHAIFEATHGTAPKYANQDKVNPTSLILSGVMMFDYIGWNEVSKLIINAFIKTIMQKRVTYDLE
ncbi:NADP-dependent isocitrate dehydrogenase, partial [bacterium]